MSRVPHRSLSSRSECNQGSVTSLTAGGDKALFLRQLEGIVIAEELLGRRRPPPETEPSRGRRCDSNVSPTKGTQRAGWRVRARRHLGSEESMAQATRPTPQASLRGFSVSWLPHSFPLTRFLLFLCFASSHGSRMALRINTDAFQ